VHRGHDLPVAAKVLLKKYQHHPGMVCRFRKRRGSPAACSTPASCRSTTSAWQPTAAPASR
jgi:hypothetical protein